MSRKEVHREANIRRYVRRAGGVCLLSGHLGQCQKYIFKQRGEVCPASYIA